jgi:glycosyltransferase involved in cell wall biosynthesis
VDPPHPEPFRYDVVIPTHGRNIAFLTDAIGSVTRQTLPPHEVIVVVDGKRGIGEALRRIPGPIRMIELPEPSGQAEARQVGIEAATASWVAFLDDDDLWAATKQERTVRYLATHPEAKAVRAGYWMFSAVQDDVEGLNGQRVEIRGDRIAELEAAAAHAAPLNDLDYLDILGDRLGLMLEFNRGVISTSVVRRDVLTSIPRVPRGQRPGNDYMLFAHVAAATEWHLIRERLGFYRVHAGQDTLTRFPGRAQGILSAKKQLWARYADRAPRPLTAYGSIYRAEVRQFLWVLLKSGDVVEAVRTFEDAKELLPRLEDRALALVPEPIVWHAEDLRRRLRRAFGRTAADSVGPSW